jgi:hypothetical protein
MNNSYFLFNTTIVINNFTYFISSNTCKTLDAHHRRNLLSIYYGDSPRPTITDQTLHCPLSIYYGDSPRPTMTDQTLHCPLSIYYGDSPRPPMTDQTFHCLPKMFSIYTIRIGRTSSDVRHIHVVKKG